MKKFVGGSWEQNYPFTAIVGQENVKTSLILNAINPTIGGVLISGPKGSGKSLLVKAFSEILPEIEHVEGCPFQCSPNDPTNMCPSCLSRTESGEKPPVAKTLMKIVRVPLSVTDDMLIGSLDLDQATLKGVKALRPGLLAKANQNILYIDEVNLLPDHLTDSILDAAASGWNIVEREGVSVAHPSRFILIGTMNPEEGELRPQILDRFGVYAETKNIHDLDLRALVINRNENFIRDPSSIIKNFHGEVAELKSRIETARKILPNVQVSEETYSTVASICKTLRVDGFRPDIVGLKVAKALAAFQGRGKVTKEDASPSLELALGHRTRQSGLEPPSSPKQIRDALKRAGRRELKILGKLNINKLIGVQPFSKEFLRKIMKRALLELVLTLTLVAAMAFSLTILIDGLRGALSTLPSTPQILLIEILVAGVLSILLTLLTSKGRRHRESIPTRLDLSKVIFETDGRLMPPRKTDTVTGSGSAEVRYKNEFSTTPDYGFKILRSIEGLYKGTRRVEPDFRSWSFGEGGYARGRRVKKVSSSSRGRFSWYQQPKGRLTDIALSPTLRIAALHKLQRKDRSSRRLIIKPEDIRVKVREYRAPSSILLLIDMSLSMINSINNLILAIYNLQRNILRRRDRVGLIIFKGSKAFTLQHPTTNISLIIKKLKEVGASDFTPMASGLTQALKILKQEKIRNRDAIPNLIIFSDGLVNVPLKTPLSPMTRRRYSSEAQADSIDVAHLISKENFKVHVINTNHSKQDANSIPIRTGGWRVSLKPTQFLIELARISNGNYHGLILTETES